MYALRTDTQVSKTSIATKTKVESSYKAWFSPVSEKMSCSVSSNSSNERTSYKSVKYNVSVKASDSGPPEGLSRLLDIFESAIPKHADLDRMADSQSGSSDEPDERENNVDT